MKQSIKQWFEKVCGIFLSAVVFVTFVCSLQAHSQPKIDREAVVKRHCYDINSPYEITTLGNGEFAFNCDATGLQTFAGNTLSHWGWHSNDLPAGMTPQDRVRTPFATHDRVRQYLHPWTPEQRDLVKWLNDNPHQMNLGRIALRGENGFPVKPEDIDVIFRKYDIWTGKVESSFHYRNTPVHVTTVCHPVKDAVSVKIKSPLIKTQKIGIALTFPYPTALPGNGRFPESILSHFTGDFTKTSGHATVINKDQTDPGQVTVKRTMDDGGEYDLYISHSKGLEERKISSNSEDIANVHTLFFYGNDMDEIEFTVWFVPLKVTQNASSFDLNKKTDPYIPSFAETLIASAKHWNTFWNTGGFIDLSGSKDVRWKELERRIILSQFVTAVNSAGSKPPSEAGLHLVDTWCGKFHLEMTAWHGAHFAFWGRPYLLDKWTEWYRTIGLQSAKEEARTEGWKGAKWLKTPDPYGRWESWDHGTNRVTQNVHPFYIAELLYRAFPANETLYKWKDVIFETSSMMLDFLYWDETTGRYILGPPVMSGAEGNSGFESWNATSELNYWTMSLLITKKWRERLGMSADEKLEHVLTHISTPPVVDGVYIDAESHPQVWNKTPDGRHFLRPAWLEVYGCIAGPLIEKDVMEKTYEKICQGLRSGEWRGNLWGCDYPMLAMTAARLGKPEEAVDWLLFNAPLNDYSPGGYNTGWYLPGNGGLLWAVALMTAGWEGARNVEIPGFPKDKWNVKFEDIVVVP